MRSAQNFSRKLSGDLLRGLELLYCELASLCIYTNFFFFFEPRLSLAFSMGVCFLALLLSLLMLVS